MQTSFDKTIQSLPRLASYSRYILQNKFDEFLQHQFKLSYELEVPMLRHFNGPNDPELLSLAKTSLTDLLEHLVDDDAEGHINKSLQRWTDNVYEQVDKYSVAADDIHLITYIRKNSFLHFLPSYCSDVNETVSIIAELETYCTRSEMRSINTLISLLNNQLKQQAAEAEGVHTNLIADLERNERLYREAEAIGNMGNFVWNLKTNTITWTDQLYLIYGLEPQSEPVTIDKFMSLVHPDDKERISRGLNQTITDELIDFTFRIITAENKVKMIHSIARIQKGEDGQAEFVIGTERDITEKQSLINKLQESERLYRQAQKIAKLGSWSMNFSTRQISWSDEVFEIYGLPTGTELSVEQWSEFIHPDDKNEIMAHYELCLKEKRDYERSHRIILKDGQEKVIQRRGEFILNEAGEPEKIIGTTQDITKQAAASQLIKDQEYFIRQIADASPTILYLFDVPSQKMVYVNREIFFVLGYGPEEVMRMEDHVTGKLYHPEEYSLLPGRKEDGKTFSQINSMIQYECRLKHKNQDYRWFLVREVVFKTDSKGQISQILGAALDINKRKEMEKTILQNTHLLEQSNASLEEFAYVASHDLKEPLRKISTFGDRIVASQQGSLSEDGKMFLSKIVDASQRMQIMIDDLLSISMISGNKAFESYSLQKILDESLQALEHKIEQQNATIEADYLPEATMVASQFRQLFQNLISNSLKFVRPGVPPKITIKHSWINPGDMPTYQVSPAKRYHQLAFQDNGIGFENEYGGKIFAIFQRLHGRSEYEGSGIGLAICKKIVEHHGGVIFASGIPNVGASFTIILPE